MVFYGVNEIKRFNNYIIYFYDNFFGKFNFIVVINFYNF